jgi:Phosphodiester glycosidase
MRHRRLHLTLLFLLILLQTHSLVFSAPDNEPEAPDAWSAVALGIEYQKYHRSSPRPINIFVTRMDRSNPNVAVDSSIAQGRLSGGTETVNGMASRYDQAINYWGQTWGNRNRVVVAINGYFFGAPDEPPGVPWSGMVQSGWYAKRFTELSGDAGFTWMLDGEAFIGKCVYHRAARNDVYFPSAGYDPNIDLINVAREDEGDELILYTPQYDATTRTLENGPTPRAEILIELKRPGLLISDPAYVQGTIRGIRKNNGSTPIPFDHVVLAAWGDVGNALVNRINSDDIQVGDEVRITQEITDCAADPQHDWTKAYASTGGDYHFLRRGTYYAPSNPDATWPNSRTVVAYNASYVYFIVVDAFDPGVSEGITIPELNSFLRNTLGATDAVSLDSGTSSTMVVNGQVVNNTYCTFTRDCGMQNRLEITPPSLNRAAPGSATEWSPLENQAYVGNGLMMVYVEPRTLSSAFRSGETVTATSATSMRLGPGTNYATTASISSGAQGVVQTHGLDGVLARGFCWWKVTFGGNTGWVIEGILKGEPIPPSPPVLGDFNRFLPLIELNTPLGAACSAR